MGMYDHITCQYKLPLPEDAVNLSSNWSEEIFQTKDLDNYLGSYRITEDGLLVEECAEREYIEFTEEERAELKKDKRKLFLSFGFKDIIIKNKYDKQINHHGKINFYHVLPYTAEEDYWLEFDAFFIYGKLDKIELTKAEKHKSQKLHNSEWEARRLAESIKPWSMLKRRLTPLGWRWTWRKAASLCRFVSDKSSKLEHLIYRHML